jgi:hypothetical protein
MRPDEFFRDDVRTSFGMEMETRTFRRDLVRAIRQGPLPDVSDAEVAVGLARLVHEELEIYGTSGGPQMDDGDMRDALLALRAVTQRLAVEPPEIPFRDFTTFRSYWKRQGATDSWQARRDILDEIFTTLHDRLADIESAALTSSLAQPVSPRSRTGWARVDEEIAELKRHFRNAQTPQDYRNVGNDCVIVTETLSREAYDPARHLRAGETEPPVANTKQRLERFVEDAAPGPDNAALRKLARAAIEMAQAVKHSSTPTRREAGIAADAVILLANLLRRLDEPT